MMAEAAEKAKHPMTAFLIPVRPRATANCWEEVLVLLRGTLRSLAQQSDERLVVFIISTDPLGLEGEFDERFRWHVLTDIPEKPEHVYAGDHDKSWKLKYAGVLAQAETPSHFFLLDADDRLAADLNERVLDEAAPAGLRVFDVGYEYHAGLRKAIRGEKLSHICGSTFAFPVAFFPLPKRYDWQSIEPCMALRLAHDKVVEFCEQKEIPFSCDAASGVLYFRGGSVSMSDMVYRGGRGGRLRTICKFLLYGRKLSKSERETFCLS